MLKTGGGEATQEDGPVLLSQSIIASKEVGRLL